MGRRIHLLFISIILVVGMAGCAKPKNIGYDKKSNETVIINLEGGDYGYPTPFLHYARGPGIFKMTLIFDSLLERGEEGYIPWLAEKWDISPDGTLYTFTLRENIKWHDGLPMTAEDVKFSFEFFEKYPPVFNDLILDGQSFIQSVEVIDNLKVCIKVEEPLAVILGKIGSVRIIPKHIWEDVEDPYKFSAPEAVIGTGPFVLKNYNREQGAYQYEAFKDFWGPLPLVNVLQFVPVSDSILAFDKGEIDLTRVPSDILSKYEGNEEYKVLQNPAMWGYRLILNMEKRPELKNKNIRQAMAYAIDRKELVEKVARGAGVPASDGYLPVDHVWYNRNVKSYEYNIEKARGLLNGQRISYDLLTGNSNAEIRIAELLKISMEKAGILLNVTSVDTKTRDAAVKSGDYELVINGHGGWGNDADYLRPMYTKQEVIGQSPASDGIPGYYNEEINELCRLQLFELDAEKRKAIIFELQELIAKEIPQIPLYNTADYVVYKPSKYNGWKYMFDHHDVTHNKLSYLDVKQPE